jgi:transcriptional regulator with XRE-family HTH domain
MAWGEWLQRYRLAAGQSQKALSARAGLSARTISALERGIMERPYEDTVALP